MCEILFRGKRTDNGEWVYGVPVVVEAESGIKMFIISYAKWESDNNSIDFLETDVEEIIPETRGQYTGLTDKNGRKIFEGDIIRRKVNVYELGKREPIGERMLCGVVEWDNSHIHNVGSWSLYAHDKYGNNERYIFDDSYEVIGNIHDNPKLLNGV